VIRLDIDLSPLVRVCEWEFRHEIGPASVPGTDTHGKPKDEIKREIKKHRTFDERSGYVSVGFPKFNSRLLKLLRSLSSLIPALTLNGEERSCQAKKR
jgi:hypothetical protein